MDKKHSVFDYLTQIFMIYGITAVLLNIFCLLFGAGAQEYSTIFRFGAEALGVATSFQFLLAIACVVTLRFLFMTDAVIRRMPLAVRIVLLFVSAFAVILGFIFLFGWFPAGEPRAWVMFILCFAVSCTVSTLISIAAEKTENKKLAQALQKLKEEQ